MRKEFVCLVTRCLLALGFSCAISAQVADAQTTINVPADQPTIQAAINAASNGDTVVVAPGTYFENLNFNGKFITVTSSDGPAVTIVDGGGIGPVVTFETNEGANSLLNGLTLRDGVPAKFFPISGVSGGGILILNASPTITANVITGNHAICGIGIEIQGGSPIIRGNTIADNTQAGGSGGCGGGGIEVTPGSNPSKPAPQIIGNTITNNSLLGGGNGGGINVFGSWPVIQNNYIAGNSVWNFGGGINLDQGGAPVVVQNVIVKNSTAAGGSGAGISVQGAPAAGAVVADNTIVGNTAFDASSGIFAEVRSALPISNNIVAAASGQNGVVCSTFSLALPTFSHNDVVASGTSGEAWSGSCTSAAASNGDISVDPQLVDQVNGDYHPQAGSPVIDAGDNAAPSLPQQDFDGNPRVAVGNATTCSDTVDMGAYEFVLSSTPAATLTPSALDFGFVSVGSSSAPQTVTFTATQGCGAKPAITVSGDYYETDNCTSVLGTGASCIIQVTFSPITSSTSTGTLTAVSGNISLSTRLTGQGQSGLATLSPTSLSFGSQLVNTTSAAQTVTLSNTGTGSLQVSSITTSGDFSQSNICPATLNAGSSCAIQVTFQPLATGVRSGSLTISSNSATAAPVVSLSGTGVQPAISVSPASVNFGDQPINTTAPDQTITVTNAGTATLHISSTLVSGDPDLNVILSNCTVAVPPAGSCTIDVGFTPRSAGPASATLSIASDAPTSPTTVALSGSGIDPIGSLSPSGLNFGNQVLNTSSAAQTVTLSNTGTDPLSISGISVSGDFTQTNTCPASLAVGSSCAIQVTFHPTVTGTRSGFLTVSSNSSPPVVSDFVTGTGVNPAISVSPGSIAFGDQPVNTDAPSQAITVSNPGTTTLHVNSLSISGDPDFFTLTNNCVGGTGVAPGGSCSIQVEFAPKSAGPGSATLNITSDAPTSPTSISLSGNGINSIGSLSTAGLNFGSQLVSTSSASQTVTLSNTGTSPLQINSISISGDFSQSNVCPASLNPGSSCTIQVIFQPTTTGTRSGSLNISSNSTQPVPAVSLTGTGVDYSVSASPASISTRLGHQAQTSIIVSALGGSVNNSVALSCSNLPTGASCSFSPSAVVPDATSASSRLTINTQQSGGTKTPPGTYSVTVLGTSSGLARSTVVTLTITN